MTPYRGYHLFSIKSSVFPQMGCQSEDIIWWAKSKERQKKRKRWRKSPCSDSVHSTDDFEIQLVIIYESMSSAFWLPSSAAFILSYNKVKKTLLTACILNYTWTHRALNKHQTRRNTFSRIVLTVTFHSLRANQVVDRPLKILRSLQIYRGDDYY